MAGDAAQLPALGAGGAGGWVGGCTDTVDTDLGAGVRTAGPFPFVSARHAEVSAGDTLQ